MKGKLIITMALVLVAALAVGGVALAAGTTSQKISFNFDPTDGTGWGGVYSFIPPYSSRTAAANFDGNLLTDGSGKQKITTLTGTLKLDPGQATQEVYTIQLKPDGMYTYYYPPTPGCQVACHQTIAAVAIKYQGEGSNARDGAGMLQWQTTTGLPVAPSTRSNAYLWGTLVSKDEAVQINLWDRFTPTIQ